MPRSGPAFASRTVPIAPSLAGNSTRHGERSIRRRGCDILLPSLDDSRRRLTGLERPTPSSIAISTSGRRWSP